MSADEKPDENDGGYAYTLSIRDGEFIFRFGDREFALKDIEPSQGEEFSLSWDGEKFEVQTRLKGEVTQRTYIERIPLGFQQVRR